MVEPQMVRVLGRSAFHDTALTSSGDLSYLGGEVRNYNSFMTLPFLIIDRCCLISNLETGVLFLVFNKTLRNITPSSNVLLHMPI